MKGISFYFMVLAVIAVTCGMALGIHMAISHDHTLAPVHAHLNLIGWVTMALFAIYYHIVPQAGQGLLPKIHLAVATVGVVTIVPGIALAVTKQTEGLAAIGSIITLVSMVIFLITVVKTGKARD